MREWLSAVMGIPPAVAETFRSIWQSIKVHIRLSGHLKAGQTTGEGAASTEPGTKGILLQSPNGSWWLVTIGNTGALTATTVGVNPPPE